MNRRTMIQGTAAAIATIGLGITDTGAQSTRVEETWDTTTANRIERLTVSIDAYATEEEADQEFATRLGNVKDGTIYDEAIKTFGDESFIVHYQYPYMATYEGNCRVGNLVLLVVWDAIFIDGHVEGHRVFESLVDRMEVKESYTEQDLQAMLPTDDELADLELN